jgi:hypothetical protein
MQTFVPSDNIEEIAKILDFRRLGKQRVEARQILATLRTPNARSWRKHPAVIMWRGYETYLTLYYNLMVKEWVRRGYNNNMPLIDVKGTIIVPYWWGYSIIHSSHRAALLHKDYEYYKQFGWKEEPKIQYYWPRIVPIPISEVK